MALIWSIESSLIGLDSFKYRVTPSLADLISLPSELKRSFSFSISLFFMGRDASAMSVVPLMSAEIPTPEPPPVTWITMSGCFVMYSSAQRWARMTIVSEPFTVIVFFPPAAISINDAATSSPAMQSRNVLLFIIDSPLLNII